MKSNFFLRLIIVSLYLFGAAPLQAQPITEPQARAWVQEKGESLLNAFSETDLTARYAKLDDMFVNYIDLDYISKFVLGKYWRQLDEEGQQNYQQLFRRYALSVYKSFPLEFDTSQIDFSINKVRIEREFANVTAAIRFSMGNNPNEKQSILVSFRLNNRDGNLRIVDLKLGESSLILSYRSRFYEMIANDDEDLGWFIEDLQMITESTEKQNQLKLEQQEYL